MKHRKRNKRSRRPGGPSPTRPLGAGLIIPHVPPGQRIRRELTPRRLWILLGAVLLMIAVALLVILRP